MSFLGHFLIFLFFGMKFWLNRIFFLLKIFNAQNKILKVNFEYFEKICNLIPKLFGFGINRRFLINECHFHIFSPSPRFWRQNRSQDFKTLRLRKITFSKWSGKSNKIAPRRQIISPNAISQHHYLWKLGPKVGRFWLEINLFWKPLDLIKTFEYDDEDHNCRISLFQKVRID